MEAGPHPAERLRRVVVLSAAGTGCVVASIILGLGVGRAGDAVFASGTDGAQLREVQARLRQVDARLSPQEEVWWPPPLADRRPSRARRSRAAIGPAVVRPGDGYDSPSRWPRIRVIQRALVRLDLAQNRVVSARTGRSVTLASTGQFGPVTEGGVRRFQRRAGLPVTGAVDRVTLARLRAAARRSAGANRSPGR